ncbi:MAG: hypothetical protein HP058_03725 [Massilimaliae sp.]|nr:hypothetical protein [Massiliimalia sp.]
MFNAILDRLPEDYEGWLIRTDYRIGVQIQLCVSDPDLSEYERTATSLKLLYGNGIPDLETALSGLSWFMSCGNPPQRQESGEEPDVYSFEYDSGRIVSAFKKVFGRDISRERLHWFEFVPMLGELQETAFANVMEIRNTKSSEIDSKHRAEFERMKKRFALPGQYSAEEEAKINSIIDMVKNNP